MHQWSQRCYDPSERKKEEKKEGRKREGRRDKGGKRRGKFERIFKAKPRVERSKRIKMN